MYNIQQQGKQGLLNQTVVDCSKLKMGMTVKNYKEMCKLLNESVSEGNSKKSQLNRWKCFFDYEKDGQKFIIGEIFDTPLPSFDARKLKDSIYVKYIELLLMEYLSKQKGYTATLTKKDLYWMLGMSNLMYRDKDTTYETIKTAMNSDYSYPASNEDIQIFYQRADRKLNSILTSALKSMANRFLIKYTTEYVIFEKVADCDRYSKEIARNVFRIAGDEEVRLILKAQRESVGTLGYTSYSDLFLQNKVKDYFKELDNYVKVNYGWEFVYSQIKIIYLADEIERQMPIRADEIRRLTLGGKIEGLNQAVIDSLNTQTQKRYGGQQEQLFDKVNDNVISQNKQCDKSGAEHVENMLYDSNFIAVQRQLVDYLIKINDTEKAYILNKFKRNDSKGQTDRYYLDDWD